MITQLKETTKIPWMLLLEADPEKEKVLSYIETGIIFVSILEESINGILVLQERAEEWEVMNLAVAADVQGQGIGTQLLRKAEHYVCHHRQKQNVVLIRTGSLPSPALHLYQKEGYQIQKVVKNYFVDHYKEPIIENGQLLKDQVILIKRLDE